MTQESTEVQLPEPEVTFEGNVVHISSGNKHLQLIIDLIASTAVSHLETLKDHSKEFGDTTKVYQSALKILRGMATEHQTSIEYSFSTTDKKMKAWARDPQKGMAIFNWDSFKDEGGVLQATKTIYP